MTDEPRSTPKERETTKETGALLLAIGGLAAAFGAASCCAIPMLLITSIRKPAGSWLKQTP